MGSEYEYIEMTLQWHFETKASVFVVVVVLCCFFVVVFFVFY